MASKDFYSVAYEAEHALYVVREKATGRKVGTAPTEHGASHVALNAYRRQERAARDEEVNLF